MEIKHYKFRKRLYDPITMLQRQCNKLVYQTKKETLMIRCITKINTDYLALLKECKDKLGDEFIEEWVTNHKESQYAMDALSELLAATVSAKNTKTKEKE